jgi:hypothetical protein
MLLFAGLPLIRNHPRVETNIQVAVDEIETVIEIRESIRAIRATPTRGRGREAPHQASITNRQRNPGVK